MNTVHAVGNIPSASKGVAGNEPGQVDFTAGDLQLSAQDINGDVRSVQSFQENGSKGFAAGGAKHDTFHVVGGNGLADLKKSLAIVIGEGHATADTLLQAFGYATVAAFDSGNLPSIASLRDKFPDKPFIIAGDNDLQLELTEGRNLGKEKAQAAAKSVNDTTIFPIFEPGEQSYPESLPPVTPGKARSGKLREAQKVAIAQMKQLTDFNDFAANSALGVGGVQRQVAKFVVKIQKQAVIN